MTVEQSVEVAKVIVSLLQALIWPVVVLFILFLLKAPLAKLIGNAGELTLDAFGVQATVKREHIQAAALLGAAEARRAVAVTGNQEPPPQGSVGQVADVVTEAVTQKSARRLSEALVLWVDDRPDNNIYERQALEALGIRFVISTSTEDALEKASQAKFDAIISDMGRPPDPRAGYTLLDKLRMSNNATPFIIYAGSNLPEHKAEAREHGALGSTNNPQELFQLVVRAVLTERGDRGLAA